MATEVSAEFACGKILFGIRQSKLNYVLNETPYSAYITIRKKFTNGVIVNNKEMAKDASGVNVLESNLAKENLELKVKLKDLETTCALIRIENEEFELKNDSLKNKPTCARVAAMTTVAHNKDKQYSFNAKVNLTLLLPYA